MQKGCLKAQIHSFDNTVCVLTVFFKASILLCSSPLSSSLCKSFIFVSCSSDTRFSSLCCSFSCERSLLHSSLKVTNEEINYMLKIYCSFLWLLISELYCTCILFFGKKKLLTQQHSHKINTQLEFYLCHLLIHKSFRSMVDMTVIFGASTTLSKSTQKNLP